MRPKIRLGLFLFLLLAACAHTGIGSVKPYPLDVCLVTGNSLGSMGDPVSIVYEGQELKFCCQPCVKKFRANPEKYLKKLNDTVNSEKVMPVDAHPWREVRRPSSNPPGGRRDGRPQSSRTPAQ